MILKSELTDNERRITRLEVEKQNYIREVATLKSQLDQVKVDRITKFSR